MDTLLDRIHRWVAMGNPACKRVLLHPDDVKALNKINPDKLKAIIGDRPIEWLGEKK